MRNRTVGLLAVGTVLVQLAVPSVAFAVRSQWMGNGMPDSREAGSVRAGICENIEEIGGRMLDRIGDQAYRFALRRTERDGRLDELRTGRETGLARARAEQDRRHERRYGLMLGQAKTEDMQAAVGEFKEAVEAAVADRRRAVDLAMEDYLIGLDRAIGERRAVADEAVEDLESAVAAAVKTAKDSCAAEEGGIEVRQVLNVAVKAAHGRFVSEWLDVGSLNDTVKELVNRRNEAFRAAWVEFKAAIETARDELKARLQVLEDGNEEETADGSDSENDDSEDAEEEGTESDSEDESEGDSSVE